MYIKALFAILAGAFCVPIIFAQAQTQREHSISGHFSQDVEGSDDPAQLIGTWCGARDLCSDGRLIIWSNGGVLQGSIEHPSDSGEFLVLPVSDIRHKRTVSSGVEFSLTIDCQASNARFPSIRNQRRYVPAYVVLDTQEQTQGYKGRFYPDIMNVGLTCPGGLAMQSDPVYLRQ